MHLCIDTYLCKLDTNWRFSNDICEQVQYTIAIVYYMDASGDSATYRCMYIIH